MHSIPGRIEVLGKHTDYAGGRSLLCTVNRGFRLSSVPRDDACVRIGSATTGVAVEIDCAGGATRGDAEWRVYPETVVRRVVRDFDVRLSGCDIVFESDLPIAAGLSSSSAFVVGVFLALDEVNGLLDSPRARAAIRSREDLAEYLAAVENGMPFPPLDTAADPAGGVGTRGGSQDHTAILCCARDSLVRYSFRPVRREGVVRVARDTVFVIAASGVRAPKAGAVRERYNRLSDWAARIAHLWRNETGGTEAHVGEIVRNDPKAVERLHGIIARQSDATELDTRLSHFLAESERIVPAAAAALEQHDLDRFGVLVDESQGLAGRLLGNQVPETILLARRARELGAIAASAFGAGFGGAVWALVRADAASGFLEQWQRDYVAAYPTHAAESSFFLTPASGAAGPLPDRLRA